MPSSARRRWSRSANPLGETLELLLGAAAAALTAWQQAVAAAVFELCLVGVMVIYELLGQNAGGRVTTQDKADPEDRQPDRDPIAASAAAKPFPSPPKRSRTKAGAGLASVKTFIGERVSPADGERIEMKALVHAYRAWCGSKGVESVALESFLEVVEKVCRKIGIEIVNDAQRVFCLNVRMKPHWVKMEDIIRDDVVSHEMWDVALDAIEEKSKAEAAERRRQAASRRQ